MALTVAPPPEPRVITRAARLLARHHPFDIQIQIHGSFVATLIIQSIIHRLLFIRRRFRVFDGSSPE